MKYDPELGGRYRPRGAILEVGLIVVLTMVGGWLRFQNLGRDSLWLDEVWSFLHARLPVKDLLPHVARNVHPPLYYLLLHGVVTLGNSEAILRWPSALFGTLSIPLLYLLGRAWFSGSAGVVAALLLTLSPAHLWHSQDAKMYTLLTFEGILCWYLFAKLLEVPRGSLWVGYVLVSGAILFTHYYGALLLIPQTALVALLHRRGEVERWFWFRWLVVQGGLFLLFLPWLAFAWPLLRLEPVQWIAEAGRHPLVRVVEGLFVFTGGDAASRWVLGLPTLGLALAALLRDERREWRTLRGGLRERSILFCLGYFAVPIALMFAISFVRPLLLSRHLLMVTPAFFLLAAVGLSRLLDHRYLILGAAALVFLLLPGLIGRVTTPRTQDHRRAVSMIIANGMWGDLVLPSPPEREKILQYYLHGHKAAVRTCPDLVSDSPPEQVRLCLRDAQRVWVVFSRVPSRLKDPTFLAALEEQFRPIRTEEFFRIRIVLYERVT